MITKNVPKNPQKFICDMCDYSTCNKKDYSKHLMTAKHMKITNDIKKSPKIPILLTCVCGNTYKYKSGLSRHKKICIYTESSSSLDSTDLENTIEHNEDNTEIQMLSKTIFELVKQNNQFKELLIEQNQKIMEMTGSIGNNNTINSNNKFNLNVFLNEKCKNAMSLTDFIKSINLTVQDFIETGERGFIDGISNIIIERINNMELYDRPLHCTDLKRETVYVKDAEKWEKDEDKIKLRKAVKWVANKNERMRPIWYEETPDVDVMGTENYEKFFKYSESSLGGCGKEETKLFEDKVMKNVLKEVTIDKENYLIT